MYDPCKKVFTKKNLAKIATISEEEGEEAATAENPVDDVVEVTEHLAVNMPNIIENIANLVEIATTTPFGFFGAGQNVGGIIALFLVPGEENLFMDSLNDICDFV